MKTKPIVWLLMAATLLFGTLKVSADAGTTENTYFIVPAPTSPYLNEAIQNAMAVITHSPGVNLLSTDVLNEPGAINRPGLLRVSQIIYGPVSLKMHDAQANPTGKFANENGERLAWGHHYSNSVPFLVTERSYRIWSSDGANTIRFPASGAGNLGTNGQTGQLLVFSPTLRGRYWSEGHMTEYNSGESLLDHPVHEVFALIRVGYYAIDMSIVASDLNYFLGQMTMTNYAGFWGENGGATNWISSLPYLTGHPNNANGDKLVTLEGQRRIGMTYGIQARVSMTRGEGSWTNVVTGIVDGGWCTNTILPDYFQAYYRGVQEGVYLPMGRSALPATLPVMVGNNGPDE